MTTTARMLMVAAIAAAASSWCQTAAATPCSDAMSHNYTMTWNQNGTSYSTTITFVIMSGKSISRLGTVHPFGGFHHNVDVMGHQLDISDCLVVGGNADFALYALGPNNHLGNIAAEWQFTPNGPNYTVADDLPSLYGTSLTAGMTSGATTPAP